MTKNREKLSLIDHLAECVGCQMVSDLHYLDGSQRGRLREHLLEIKEEEHSLYEWNDTLEYLACHPECKTRSDAKALLLKLLA